jgi:hypothetical protein
MAVTFTIDNVELISTTHTTRNEEDVVINTFEKNKTFATVTFTDGTNSVTRQYSVRNTEYANSDNFNSRLQNVANFLETEVWSS